MYTKANTKHLILIVDYIKMVNDLKKTFFLTKKTISFFIGVLIAICLTPTTYEVQAADNDNFAVTMNGAYLECNIDNTTWAIGTVTMSTTYWTNGTETSLNVSINVDTNNCTAGTNIDFPMAISSDAATWKTVWDINFTTGPDQYKLNATSDCFATQVALNLTTYADVDDDFDPANNVTLDLRFASPTSTTTGVGQSITLNGKVEVH